MFALQSWGVSLNLQHPHKKPAALTCNPSIEGLGQEDARSSLVSEKPGLETERQRFVSNSGFHIAQTGASTHTLVYTIHTCTKKSIINS